MTTHSAIAAETIRATIQRIIERVNTLSAGDPGWTRPSYSDLESAAHAMIAEEALALGLTITRDAAGNLFARMRGSEPGATPLYVGSHLDTVAEGGAYDGQAGVAGALALVAAFRAENTLPRADLVVVVTRAEESVWFPVSYVGSRAALGLLTPEEMQAKRTDTQRSLADHMRDQGYDPDAVAKLVPPAPSRFLEFHIEQGPVLFTAGEPYAIVTAIRGGLRYRAARVNGVWAHSGAAPRDTRADAVVAFSELVVAMDKVWDEMLAQGDDLTVTFGRVDAASPAHAMAKVAGKLDFCLDMRSADVAILEEADRRLKAEIALIEARRPSIRFELGRQSVSKPAALSKLMADFVADGAAMRGDTPRRMLSGGGHDAAAFASAGWESVMVFIRNWDGSHCPEEGMDMEDLAVAVEAVYSSLGLEASR